MFCSKCGIEIKEGSSFCHKCGNRTYDANADAPFSGANTTDAADHNTRYDVILTNVGENKMAVIKAVKEASGLGLSESKSLVDKAPCLIMKGVSESEAKLAMQRLVTDGAKAILKFCPSCGGVLSADSRECSACGNEASVVLPSIARGQDREPKTSSAPGQPSNPGKLYCPHCKSQNLQTIVETNTESKGGGYGAGKGCLGYLIFGPLGLLCGACGSKVKINTTNRTFFMCMGCGNKFREVEEFQQEKTSQSIKCFIIGAILIALAILMLSDGQILLGLVLFAGGGLCILAVVLLIKEILDIWTNQYEAEPYKKSDD